MISSNAETKDGCVDRLDVDQTGSTIWRPRQIIYRFAIILMKKLSGSAQAAVLPSPDQRD
ncbi:MULTISPECIES: hypothetical protein [unclassified Beijerinckia]|uniref:hypothetical protein n=1 Tax=unclassified Beijerinckia TaxID=2638183 RepID=UPI00089D21EA|nr:MULTISPECIES: hypothetical protein [unclassified Beijerinckia]MDH7796270.1 hypothetical protein [Beijerinckia sp. GAS462]SEC37838.1 hypothetical protein SAMN05443249_2553 [Beijerinckia sp. 28-YEA-48]